MKDWCNISIDGVFYSLRRAPSLFSSSLIILWARKRVPASWGAIYFDLALLLGLLLLLLLPLEQFHIFLGQLLILLRDQSASRWVYSFGVFTVPSIYDWDVFVPLIEALSRLKPFCWVFPFLPHPFRPLFGTLILLASRHEGRWLLILFLRYDVHESYSTDQKAGVIGSMMP